MGNSKIWIPGKNYFVLLLPPSLTNRMKGLSGSISPTTCKNVLNLKKNQKMQQNSSKTFQKFHTLTIKVKIRNMVKIDKIRIV
jgi:hypothetical protein